MAGDDINQRRQCGLLIKSKIWVSPHVIVRLLFSLLQHKECFGVDFIKIGSGP